MCVVRSTHRSERKLEETALLPRNKESKVDNGGTEERGIENCLDLICKRTNPDMSHHLSKGVVVAKR